MANLDSDSEFAIIILKGRQTNPFGLKSGPRAAAEERNKRMPNSRAIKLCIMMNFPAFGNIRLTNPGTDGKFIVNGKIRKQ